MQVVQNDYIVSLFNYLDSLICQVCQDGKDLQYVSRCSLFLRSKGRTSHCALRRTLFRLGCCDWIVGIEFGERCKQARSDVSDFFEEFGIAREAPFSKIFIANRTELFIYIIIYHLQHDLFAAIVSQCSEFILRSKCKMACSRPN
jgi:hypothetical protein